jgi:actin-related protein
MLCHQSVVSFWAYSSDSGIVCDIGERCDIVPVSQGFVLSHAWGRAPFGGHPLRHSLRQGLGPQVYIYLFELLYIVV